MTAVVLGLFEDEPRAVAALESLRLARFDTNKLRLVGGPQQTPALATDAGATAAVAAGPVSPVVEGVLAGHVSADELSAVRQRVEAGAVLIVGDDLDQGAVTQLTGLLRDHGAEPIITHDLPTTG
jgi:hypothetical protein